MELLRRQILHPARRWLEGDVPALAVDAFRILVGVLAASYFVRLLVEHPWISHPQGLIDHALTQDIYWFTRMGLFQAGMPGWIMAGTYAVGFVAALFVIAGVRIRTAALVGLIVAVSAYRWNFIVMYLDDAVVHLMLFWLLLLPTGRTLTLPGWLEGPERRGAWSDLRVPAVSVRLLLLNVCWIYFLAGAWKMNSILWREGFGLYASMKVEVARMPDFWGPEHLPFLRFSDYMVLVLEPILPLPMLLGRGRFLRYLGAVAFVVFNLFILTTLGIAWAILGLTCTLVLFLDDEVAGVLGRWLGPSPEAASGWDGEGSGVPASSPSGGPWRRADRVALAFVAVLMVATARHVPFFGALNEPAYAALWAVGVAQDYRLFNWIDRVAYKVRTRVDVTGPDGEALPVPEGAVPQRFRARLLQAYAHDVRWLILPPEGRFELRLSIVRRQASWFCRFVEEPGTRVEMVSTVHPIRPDNLDFSRYRALRLAEFECVPPGSVTPEEGGVPVPAGWPHLQAWLIQGLNPLPSPLQPYLR